MAKRKVKEVIPGVPSKEEIRDLILTNDRACARALVVLYNNQTSEEQSHQQVVEDNGVGFTKWDAGFGSKLAQDVIKGKPLGFGALAWCRRPDKWGNPRLARYHKQLIAASCIKMRQRTMEHGESVSSGNRQEA